MNCMEIVAICNPITMITFMIHLILIKFYKRYTLAWLTKLSQYLYKLDQDINTLYQYYIFSLGLIWLRLGNINLFNHRVRSTCMVQLRNTQNHIAASCLWIVSLTLWGLKLDWVNSFPMHPECAEESCWPGESTSW